MIPKVIWQTYRHHKLPPKAAAASESWRKLNPNWEYRFCSDEEICEFIDRNFGEEFKRVFHSMPLGVMKADIWRYAVLFKRGGVYADIDSTCIVPLDCWEINRESLLVALENSVHFCQWTLGAVPGQPALETVLRMIQRRAQAGIDTTYQHFVHHHTGPGVWTDALCEFLGLEGVSAIDIYQKYSKQAAQKGMRIFPAESFEQELVDHAFGSATYRKDGYVSWVAERKKLRGRRAQCTGE